MRLGLLSDRSPPDANSAASLQKTVSNIVSRSDVLQGNLGGICLWLCNCCIFKLGRTNGFSCTEQSSWWALVATRIKGSKYTISKPNMVPVCCIILLPDIYNCSHLNVNLVVECQQQEEDANLTGTRSNLFRTIFSML
ncbi:hypothetical protein OIU74_017540 [Salix koriyanagi]|uniref:Uncharacterized protein n=1 Tax=Salix koriyanagi TaxID=2511006 RepID=A0A9Q0WS53_9ROSI|nr:hypothetical protein OIU74_017540 [Salix koriyanagi]